MKKWTIALALACAATASAVQAADWTGKVIKLAVDPTYPPLEYKTPDGKLTGFGVDIANALCAQMHAKCVWVETSFDGMIPGLLARKFDVISSSMTITPKRMQQIAFSSKISNAPARLVVRRGSALLPDAASLKGKRVGVEQGTSQEDYARAMWQPAGVEIVAYQNQDQVYADLTSGRLDAALQDSVQADLGFLKTARGAGFEFTGSDLTDPKGTLGTGAAIGLRKEDTDLKDKIDKAIADMIKDGTYKKIEDKYFTFNVYGS